MKKDYSILTEAISVIDNYIKRMENNNLYTGGKATTNAYKSTNKNHKEKSLFFSIMILTAIFFAVLCIINLVMWYVN